MPSGLKHLLSNPSSQLETYPWVLYLILRQAWIQIPAPPLTSCGGWPCLTWAPNPAESGGEPWFSSTLPVCLLSLSEPHSPHLQSESNTFFLKQMRKLNQRMQAAQHMGSGQQMVGGE